MGLGAAVGAEVGAEVGAAGAEDTVIAAALPFQWYQVLQSGVVAPITTRYVPGAVPGGTCHYTV